mmetsp:Transcript_5041/g.7609  ORF Transcript_5041/g.7609 Transcript_5041/m.7609 type:complete len:191 (+) Transcript_5041:472-1044(+)
MKQILKTMKFDVPEGVEVSSKSRVVTVTGSLGTLHRNFKHLSVDIQVIEDGRVVKIDCWFADRKLSACVRSVSAAIKNMMKGVTVGFEYHMRLVYAHFPINVHIPSDKLSIEVRNYIGQKEIRRIKMLPGCTIEKGESSVKDELIIKGIDLELVSLSAALIQQSCAVKNKDIRKFLDGIYVSERTTMVKE